MADTQDREQTQNRRQNADGARRRGATDLAEGAAWVGGGAVGAALGSALGPVGTIGGAVIGGSLADKAVENNPASRRRYRREKRDS